MIHKIEKGEPYPFHNKASGVEKPILETNTAFFDILFYSGNAKEDAKFWGKSPLKLYAIYLEYIPFIAVKFPKENFEFDVSMNFLKVSNDHRYPWLQNNGNIINLVLIDANTNIVKGIRTISVSFSNKFREECQNQIDNYSTFIQVDKKISDIQSKYRTSELIIISRNNDH